jgi:hypothetical protein
MIRLSTSPTYSYCRHYGVPCRVSPALDTVRTLHRWSLVVLPNGHEGQRDKLEAVIKDLIDYRNQRDAKFRQLQTLILLVTLVCP